MAKEKFKPYILVDTREKKPLEFRKSTKCAGSIKQKLDTGDYTIQGMEDIFIIERKGCVAELYMNLGIESKRFWKEMERMKDFKYRFLFFEFLPQDIYEYPTICKRIRRPCRMAPEFITSRLTKLQTEYGIHCIFLGDIMDPKKRPKIKAYINDFMYKMYNMYKNGKLE